MMPGSVFEVAIDAISLGNGTASRETERFLKRLRHSRKVDVYVVSENGASIYSASKIERVEFPFDILDFSSVVLADRLAFAGVFDLFQTCAVGRERRGYIEEQIADALTFLFES